MIDDQVCWYCHAHPTDVKTLCLSIGSKDGEWYKRYSTIDKYDYQHLHIVTMETKHGQRLTKRLWCSAIPFRRPINART